MPAEYSPLEALTWTVDKQHGQRTGSTVGPVWLAMALIGRWNQGVEILVSIRLSRGRDLS